MPLGVPNSSGCLTENERPWRRHARANHGPLWSLWDMLQNYIPIYEIALELGTLRRHAETYGSIGSGEVGEYDSVAGAFGPLLVKIQRECLAYGLTHTSKLAERVTNRPMPPTYPLLLSEVNHLNDSLSHELEKEAVFRIPPERKDYFERDNLFGLEVHIAFPSCAEDIQRAGSCYALGQGDASIHHLMLVLERGLHALADKVGVVFHHTNWQIIIDGIGKELRSLPRGAQRDFYIEVNSQFGHLKNTYRNHSEHVHDVPYDIETALSTFNHVRVFMQDLQRGGLTE
jgi:hypothetical protein